MYRICGIILILAGIVLAGFTPLFNPSFVEISNLIIESNALQWTCFSCGLAVIGVGISLIYLELTMANKG